MIFGSSFRIQPLAWFRSRYSSRVSASCSQTETPSLLTKNASVRNVFTVGVKRSVVPAFFPYIELRCHKLYDQDVGEASGFNVSYDVNPGAFMPYSTMVSIRQALGPLVRSVDGPCQGPLEPWFLLYSRLVFVPLSTCTTTRLFDARRLPTPSTGRFQWHYWPLGSVH